MLNYMPTSKLHWFIIGMFLSAIMFDNLVLHVISVIILPLFWRDYIVPLFGALLVDGAFTGIRELSNLFGLSYTIITLILVIIFVSISKMLRI